MAEVFFIPQPVLTEKTETLEDGRILPIYKSGALLLKWSGDKPIPTIGQQITITMNDVGPAIVKGYFAGAGWLGVLTEATHPPAWLRRQRGPNLEQLKAIHGWAKLHGIRWKDKLRSAWLKSSYPGFPNGHLLQQVRNQLGPEWLSDYTNTPNPKELKQPAWLFEGIGCEFGTEIEY